MNNIELTVEMQDGTQYDVSPALPEFVAFERKYDRPATIFQNEDENRIEYLLFVCFKALERDGVDEYGSFDDFLAEIVALDVEDDDEDVPTEAAQAA